VAGTYISVPGSGQFDLKVYGNATVVAGGGNDKIEITGPGQIVVGAGNDTLTLPQSGVISQLGAAGRDTISIGIGTTTITEQGHATISGSQYTAGAFGSATLFGGELKVTASDGIATDKAISGSATLIGTSAPTKFIGGTGSASMVGGKGDDTFVGGSGHDTLVGGTGADLFEFTNHHAGGTHLIKDFVSGQDQLYLEGHSLSYLESHNDISTHGGNTFISLDGGKTTIELQGVTHLNASDITTQKH
jgi:Ca2+-binding RTX toxin-like protein